MEQIKLGKYKHYKGLTAEFLDAVNHGETLEKMALYKKLEPFSKFPAGSLWVRLLNMFLEDFNADSQTMKHFEYIGQFFNT